jgi:hypothetical protein
MRMDAEDLEYFATAEDTEIECLQVAPLAGNSCAILFLLTGPQFAATVSVIFIVDGFRPEAARGVLYTEEWLMSLSASPAGELFALEATKWIWRLAGETWTRDRVSDSDFRTVWAKDPAGPLAVGDDGSAVRLSGETWTQIPSITKSAYNDVHGRPKNGLFAVGDFGTLHRLDDNRWQPVELHRQENLRGVEVAPDGTIRIAGDDGTCLRVSESEVIELENSGYTYFAVRTLKGKIYWGDEAGVYIEKGNRLEFLQDTGIASDMRTDGEYLYVAGIDAAWRFDGIRWSSLRLVYRDGLRLVSD